MLSILSDIFVVPTKTPADEVDALRAAPQYALTNATVKAEALSEGLAPGYLSGPTVKAQYISAIKRGPVVTSYLQG
jgi:tripartite-type tricarboxylate transporter receptor subunit TctC